MSVLDLARNHIDGRYRLVHLGDPMPLPRPRVKIMPGKDGSHWPKFYLPAKARHRMDEIAREWQRLHYPTLDGPLVCEASFVCSRPVSHLGTGKNASTVKPRHSADRPHGDVDNMAKLALDALTGTGFSDDDQVVQLHAEKLYADQANLAEPQTIIELRPLADTRALFAVEPARTGPYEVEAA